MLKKLTTFINESRNKNINEDFGSVSNVVNEEQIDEDSEMMTVTFMANKNYKEVINQFVKDCKGNGIKYNILQSNKVSVEKTKKSEFAIKLAKERLGSHNIVVNENIESLNESFKPGDKVKHSYYKDEKFTIKTKPSKLSDLIKAGYDGDNEDLEELADDGVLLYGATDKKGNKVVLDPNVIVNESFSEINEDKPFDLLEDDEKISQLLDATFKLQNNLDFYRNADQSAKKAALKALQYHMSYQRELFNTFVRTEKAKLFGTKVNEAKNGNDLNDIPMYLKKEGWVSDMENPEMYDYSLSDEGLKINDKQTAKSIRNFLYALGYEAVVKGDHVIVKESYNEIN